MKTIFALFFLFATISQGETCDLFTGKYKTVSTPCRYSHDGVKFFNEGYREFHIAYKEQGNLLRVVMNPEDGTYTLNYNADGKEHVGRPDFEGDKYTAICSNNQIHVRAVVSALKYPLVTDYTLTSMDKLTYRESFEGSSFTRICEMDRSSNE